MTHVNFYLNISPPVHNDLFWSLIEDELKETQQGLKRRFADCEYDHEQIEPSYFQWALLRSLNVDMRMRLTVRSAFMELVRPLERMGAVVDYEEEVIDDGASSDT